MMVNKNTNNMNNYTWHPASGKMPEVSGDYLLSIKRYGKKFMAIHHYDIVTRLWDMPFCDEILAWCELPPMYGED